MSELFQRKTTYKKLIHAVQNKNENEFTFCQWHGGHHKLDTKYFMNLTL